MSRDTGTAAAAAITRRPPTARFIPDTVDPTAIGRALIMAIRAGDSPVVTGAGKGEATSVTMGVVGHRLPW